MDVLIAKIILGIIKGRPICNIDDKKFWGGIYGRNDRFTARDQFERNIDENAEGVSLFIAAGTAPYGRSNHDRDAGFHPEYVAVV